LNRGGAETLELDVCRNARANGLDLTFVASGGGDLEGEFRDSGIEFVRLQRRLPVDLRLVSQLRRVIAERRIDVVHSHQPVEALHLYLATRGSAVKRVLTLHGFYPGAKNELALKFVMPRTEARVVVSREVLKLAQQQGFDTSENFFVINNGVDAQRLQGSQARLRDELGLAANHLIFGMIGNFHSVARKDQLTICKALPRLFAHTPDARFVFVGSRSEDAPRLFDDCVDFCRRAGIAERVYFLGRRSDIADVLGALDVFVLSSLREGSPISVIEAMMMGVPVVLSDIPALREVSGNGEYAALFKTGDAGDLGATLVNLVDDPEYRRALGSSGKQWAMTNFRIETHIANLMKLYSSLVSQG